MKPGVSFPLGRDACVQSGFLLDSELDEQESLSRQDGTTQHQRMYSRAAAKKKYKNYTRKDLREMKYKAELLVSHYTKAIVKQELRENKSRLDIYAQALREYALDYQGIIYNLKKRYHE